jgi:cytochrome d ubiquinol oxidase subunit II
MHRTEGAIYRRARTASLIFGALLLATFALAGVWVLAGVGGYTITAGADPAAVSNPLAKTVNVAPGAWLENYARWPLTMLVPVAGFVGTLAGMLFAWRGRTLAAFIASSVAMAGVIGTAAVSMFPFVMPSRSDPRSSLTVWDATSSHLTLGLMFWAVVIFMPLVIFYTRWAYAVMAGKVTAAYVRENQRSAY